jgi:hypothetical protein
MNSFTETLYGWAFIILPQALIALGIIFFGFPLIARYLGKLVRIFKNGMDGK